MSAMDFWNQHPEAELSGTPYAPEEVKQALAVTGTPFLITEIKRDDNATYQNKPVPRWLVEIMPDGNFDIPGNQAWLLSFGQNDRRNAQMEIMQNWLNDPNGGNIPASLEWIVPKEGNGFYSIVKPKYDSLMDADGNNIAMLSDITGDIAAAAESARNGTDATRTDEFSLDDVPF